MGRARCTCRGIRIGGKEGKEREGRSDRYIYEEGGTSFGGRRNLCEFSPRHPRNPAFPGVARITACAHIGVHDK